MLVSEGPEGVSPAGSLLPNMEARLVDDDGNDVPQGENSIGELWLRGPGVTKVSITQNIRRAPFLTFTRQGYLNNEAATRETITSDGWLKTGDIFTRDSEGLFRIVDRKKELIKYKGFQGYRPPPTFPFDSTHRFADSSACRIGKCSS